MSIALLDEIRINYGNSELEKFVHSLANNNMKEAVKLINNTNVRFPSLFILQSEINSSELFTRLSVRNKYVLRIINDILLKESLNTDRFLSEYTRENYYVMKWILETGYQEDGLNDQYDEVIDTAAIMLAKVYKDRNCLRIMEELIFNRYRNGEFIYDLVWAFFEVLNPKDLIILAKRLLSSNRKDLELVRKFLNFIPCIGMNREEDPLKQYQYSLKWIYQNQNFLYYTGETCLQTSNPCRYAVSLEAKYLQTTVSKLLTESECKILDSFRNLDDDSKVYLSSYSDMLYRISRYRWRRWLQIPIDQQLEIAKKGLEGLR